MGYLKEGSPARYHLATENHGLLIAVHKKSIPSEDCYDPDQTEKVAEQNDLPEDFIPPSSDREWGFGPVLREEQSLNPEFVIYTCDFPKRGKENSDEIWSTAATLMLFFHALNFSKESGSEVKQNLAVRMVLDRKKSYYGAGLGVELYSPLTIWIERNFNQERQISVKETMINAFHQMWNNQGDQHVFDRDFNVSVTKPDLVHLSVMGDACSLDPDEFIHNGYGYDLTPHNTDSPIQQLSLLTGVAKLEELATNRYFRKDPNQLTFWL